MVVHSTTGLKLGKVIRCDDNGFIVEKGFFFPHDHELRYDRVAKVAGSDITYQLAEGQLESVPAAAKSTESFEEERYTVPIVSTRPVVKEDARIRQDARSASSTVRHEETAVEDEIGKDSRSGSGSSSSSSSSSSSEEVNSPFKKT